MNTSVPNFNAGMSTGKAPLDPQLFINCTLDMDYLEVTKSEAIRKYEENVYLLGTIFSNRENNKDELVDEDMSDDESIDEKVLDLFDEDQNKPIINQGEYMDMDEKIQGILCDIKGNSDFNEEERALVEHVNKTLKELKDDEKIMCDSKENIRDGIKKYEEIVQK